MKTKLLILGAAALIMGPLGASAATVVTVNSTDSVYNYSGAQIAGKASTTPPEISVAGLGGKVITFSTTGQVSLTPLPEPYGLHGPDGGAPSFDMQVSAAAGLSGVISSNVGYLTGVFINGAEGTTTSLADSNFTGTGESFSSLSPAIDQVFFIGDGLTGTGAGSRQSFTAPLGATELVLGIVDADGYVGPPGAYFDNTGAYSVTVNLPGAVPEPGTWSMMLIGFGLIGFAVRAHRATGHRLTKAI